VAAASSSMWPPGRPDFDSLPAPSRAGGRASDGKERSLLDSFLKLLCQLLRSFGGYEKYAGKKPREEECMRKEAQSISVYTA
jgi:hypothetical protein